MTECPYKIYYSEYIHGDLPQDIDIINKYDIVSSKLRRMVKDEKICPRGTTHLWS